MIGEGISSVTVEQLTSDVRTQLSELMAILESAKAKSEANKQKLLADEGGVELWDAVTIESQKIAQLSELINKFQSLDHAMQPTFDTSDTAAFELFFLKIGSALSQAYDLYQSKPEVADRIKKIAESFVMWSKKKRRGNDATSMLWYTKIVS